MLVHAWFSKINLLCSGDSETQWIIWTDALDSYELSSPASRNSMTGLYDLPVRLYGPHPGQHLATTSLFSVRPRFFWCGRVQYWVRMAWQEQAAIVLFMLRRGSRNPVLEKRGCSHGGMVSWNIPPELVLRNTSALSASVCMHGTEGPIVWKAVCMIWSIRNGAERLRCLPGICVTISGIRCCLL